MPTLRRSHPILLVVALLLLALALGAAGCSSDDGSVQSGDTEDSTTDEVWEDEAANESEDSESDAAEDPPPDPTASPDVAVWIEGTWTVDHTLTIVEPETMRDAADQPVATWEATVDGSTMTIDAGEHVYEGTLTVQGDDWTYDATSTYVDSDGTTWTSDIMVDGVRESEDVFTADMAGEISSDTGGTLYIATWNQLGTRMR